MYDAIIKDLGGRLLQSLPLLAGPPTIDSVYNLYHVIFDGKLGTRPSADGSVKKLLEVLLAAQEPLSRSLLEQLDLNQSDLEQLPGWGSLFFEADHHVFLMHKSLSDWLLLDASRNSHSPDVCAWATSGWARCF